METSIYIERLRAVIATCFPAFARMAQVSSHEDFVLHISWQLQGDSNRRSKVIELTVAREMIQAYEMGSDASRQVSDARLTSMLKEKLLTFTPESDNVAGESPEMVSWLLGKLT